MLNYAKDVSKNKRTLILLLLEIKGGNEVVIKENIELQINVFNNNSS